MIFRNSTFRTFPGDETEQELEQDEEDRVDVIFGALGDALDNVGRSAKWSFKFVIHRSAIVPKSHDCLRLYSNLRYR